MSAHTPSDVPGPPNSERDRLTLKPGSVGKALFCLLAVAIVVCASTGLVLKHKTDHNRSVASARSHAAMAGTKAVAQLFSYDYRTIPEVLPDRLRLVTADFASSYRRLVTTKVEPAAARGKLTTRTDVVTTGVISANEDTVHLVMFLNQTSAKEGSKIPILTGSRVTVVMRLVGGEWKVAGVDPV